MGKGNAVSRWKQALRFAGVWWLAVVASVVPARGEVRVEGPGTPPGEVEAQFRPRSPIVGENLLLLTVRDAGGQPLSGARLRVRTDMPGMPMGMRPWPARETAPGRYEAPVELTMVGLWEFQVTVESRDGVWRKSFQKEVKPSAPPWRIWVVVGTLGILGMTVAWGRWGARGVLPPLVTAAIILGGGWAWTTVLHVPRVNTMGMKMDMADPAMGMPIHLLNAPRPVAVEEVRGGALTSEVAYTGTVAPDAEEVIFPRVTGWLLTMPFYPGHHVAPGEVVGTLDSVEISARADEARQEVRAQEHDLVVAGEREKEARSMLEKARAARRYWEGELPRAEKLLSMGAISREEHDRERSQADEALAEVRAKERNLSAASHALLHHRAMITKARASLRAAATIQDYAVLTTRLGGIVTERLVNAGVLVSPGMGVLRVADLRHVRLQAHVAERDLAGVRVGTPARARSEKLPGKTIPAAITAVFHATDPMTRTGRVEARISNPGGKLFPGDFVELRLALARRDRALTVPVSAVVPHRGGHVVWMAEDGLAKRRPVTLGISNGERWEVVKGLKEGEKVIVAGHQGLQEDDPVKEATWGTGSYREILFPIEDAEE